MAGGDDQFATEPRDSTPFRICSRSVFEATVLDRFGLHDQAIRRQAGETGERGELDARAAVVMVGGFVIDGGEHRSGANAGRAP